MNARNKAFLLVFAAFITVTVRAADESFEIEVTKDVMVPMRDGVRLATDIYRPTRNGMPVRGKFPTVLERTPYSKEDSPSGTPDMDAIHYLVPRGYVVVFQDVRGRFKSEGRWHSLRDDGNDGFDTAKWIGEQPWSDGNIGTIGNSYDGGTQHALAIANAPNIKAMFPRNAMSDVGRYGIRHNGAFELRQLIWSFMLGYALGTPTGPAAATRAASDASAIPELLDLNNHVREYIRNLPLRPGTTALKFAPDYESWLIEIMSHGDYDQYWKDFGSSVVDHIADYKDIPVYHVTGWYDSWAAPVANLNFVELRKAKKSLQRLTIGPWVHGRETSNFAGEAQFTEDAVIDLEALQLRWFDRWLRNKDNGVEREAPVRIYVMGGGDGHKTKEGRIFVGGHWRDEQEWPLARSVATAYYLHANSLLSAEKPVKESPSVYDFDPHNPVPTLGGNISSGGTLMFQGAADQHCRADFWLCSDSKPLSSRKDVLVFQTPPLSNELEVTGRLIVKLWAASNAPDTDFTAKLIDVYPPNQDYPAGVELNIADSIVRGRYRNGGKAEIMKPGQAYEFTIEMYPTSIIFKRGHRIRLDISSSNFPRFDVNPNTGEPLNDNRRWATAKNTIYHDAAHPSRIDLPIIPAGSRGPQ